MALCRAWRCSQPLLQVTLLAAALLLLAQSPVQLRADVISASSLESCVADGSSAEVSLTCAKKMVVMLSLNSANQMATEQLNFNVACVGRQVAMQLNGLSSTRYVNC